MLKYLHGSNKTRDNFAVLGTCILVEVQKNWGTSEAGYGVYMRQIQDTCIYEADIYEADPDINEADLDIYVYMRQIQI